MCVRTALEEQVHHRDEAESLDRLRCDGETVDRKRRYANILAHELGHYWFGDYVTAAGWDEIWLNESFGTWLDAKITDRVDPSWESLARSRRFAQRAMNE